MKFFVKLFAACSLFAGFFALSTTAEAQQVRTVPCGMQNDRQIMCRLVPMSQPVYRPQQPRPVMVRRPIVQPRYVERRPVNPMQPVRLFRPVVPIVPLVGREVVRYEGTGLSPEKLKQLNGLLSEQHDALLPPAPDYTGFRGQMKGHQPVPDGCREETKHDDASRQTFVTVICGR